MSSRLVVKVVNECGHPSLTIDDNHGRLLDVSLVDGVDAYVAREVRKYLNVYVDAELVGDESALTTLAQCNKKQELIF